MTATLARLSGYFFGVVAVARFQSADGRYKSTTSSVLFLTRYDTSVRQWLSTLELQHCRNERSGSIRTTKEVTIFSFQMMHLLSKL